MTPTDATAQTCARLEECGTEDSAQRTLEIEEASNRYFVHRISLAILPALISLGVSPNTVSFMGALSGLAAAWSYYHYENPWACVLGLVFMIGWHVFDGADGQLARKTGQVSPVGFIIDGVCDYLTFVFVYTALGLALVSVYGNLSWALLAAAAISHAVQAAAFEMQRESYIAWVHRPSNLSRPKRDTVTRADGLLSWLTMVYRAVQAPFQPLPSNAKDWLLSGKHASRRDFSDAYRLAFRRAVLAWSILSANNRTIAIFIFCLMGQPFWYFVYEVTILNGLLVALIAKNRKARRSFSSTLAT